MVCSYLDAEHDLADCSTPEPFYGVCCKNGKYTSGGIEPTRIYLPEYIDSRTPIYHSGVKLTNNIAYHTLSSLLGDIFSSISPMILQESSLTVSKGLNADHTPLSLTSSTLKLNSIIRDCFVSPVLTLFRY